MKLAAVVCLGVLWCAQALPPAALADPGAAQGATSDAAQVELPRIVISGLESYKKDGPDEAVKAWVKDGVLEGSPAAKAASDALREAQATYGAYRGFHVISARNLSGSTVLVYVTLDYDHGPLFAKFIAYRTTQGTVLTSLLFKMDESEILPQGCQ